MHLNHPIVGIASAQWSYSGLGYWLVNGNGTIFGFGSAPRQWPPRAPNPAQPIVGIAATPRNPGYWLVNRIGKVWAYSADNFGSAHSAHAPIVAIAASPTNFGYWVFGADGTVYPFGDARSFGNAPAHLRAPIVAAAAT